VKKIMEVLKHCGLSMVMVCLLSLGMVSTAGCAGKTKSSTVTQTTNGVSGSGSTSISSVTTQKEVVTDAHPRGVIGGIFYTIGQILWFPFRVIGNLFS